MGTGSSKSREKRYKLLVDEMWEEIEKTSNCLNEQCALNDVATRRSGWKTVRIFVSSTFKDFHQERESLVKEVFPDLKAFCEKRRLHLIDCDLRWGIPQESACEEVLRACLSEIDRCYQDNVYPYFINMTSERTGWIPDEKDVSATITQQYHLVKGLSMTEIEILHAAYRSDNPNALFMIRSSKFIDSVPFEYRHYFIDGNPISPFKLARLKEQINRRFKSEQVHYYDCEFGGVNHRTNTVKMKHLDEFKSRVFEFFKQRLCEQYSVEDIVSDPFVIAHEQHDAFRNSRSRMVVGRDELIQQIMDFIGPHTPSTSTENVPLVLLGDAGIGKTSLVAKITEDIILSLETYCADKKEEFLVISHFVGSCPYSTDFAFFLKRLLKELDPTENVERDAETLCQLIHGILSRPTGRHTVILIDAMNQFQLEDNNRLPMFAWIPRIITPNVRCVFSMIPHTKAHTLISQREPKPCVLTVPPIDKKNKKEIVTKLLGDYNKRLTDDQMNMLISKKGSENPLWLSIACEELRLFGVYRKLSDKINSLADGLQDLEMQLLERFEQEDGGVLIVATLCLLECAAHGLLETELRDMLGGTLLLPPHLLAKIRPKTASTKQKAASEQEPLNAFEWALVFRTLKPFLRPFGTSGEGRLDFYHRSFSKAVRQKYFDEGEAGPSESRETRKWWHDQLANYFEHCSNIERKAEEYPHHLTKAQRHSELEMCLCDWEIFDKLFHEEHSDSLLGYWRQIPGEFQSMENAYRTHLLNLRNSEAVEDVDLASRYKKLILILTQGGRYQGAEELLEDLRTIEQTKLGNRTEEMAELQWLTAHIMDQVMAMEEYMYRSQLPRMKTIIHHFNEAIKLYRVLDEDKYRKKLAKSLSRVAFYYGGWHLRGGDASLSADAAQKIAQQHADESADIYRTLKDDAGVADALITRGVVIGRATPEQIRFYEEAEGILLRSKGELCLNLDRLYLNEAIYFEETGLYAKAYERFRKWYQLTLALYGESHPRVRRPVATLREPMYARIAREQQHAVPEFNHD